MGISIAILLAALAYLYISDPRYGLTNPVLFMFPILGALVLVVAVTYEMEKLSMIMKTIFLVSRSRYQESIDTSDKILKSWPEDYGAMYSKAYALNMLNKQNEQLELLDQLIEKKSNKTREMATLNLKANALLQLKRYDEAGELIEAVFKKDSKNEDALYNKAVLLSKTSYRQESIKYYEDSLKIINEKLLKHGSIFKKIRRPKNLWDIELAELLTKKGIIHGKLYQYSEALENFSEALELNPENSAALNNKGYTLAKIGQYEEALKCVNESIGLYSESVHALDSKGYILTMMGNPEEALKFYQKAIEIEPWDEEKYYHKAKAHEKLRQHDMALKCYDKVLELNPNCQPAKTAKDRLNGILSNIIR